MGPSRLGSEKVWVRVVLGPKRFGSESSQKFWVRVVLGPSCLTFPGAIYMYMYMTIIVKHLLLKRLANQSQTLSGALLGKGSEN